MKAATVGSVIMLVLAHISIHAAREGGDYTRINVCVNPFLFQSTPPVKAATVTVKAERFSGDISIHAAREGGDVFAVDKLGFAVISIHAAREGGDCSTISTSFCGLSFQSTPPVKAATHSASTLSQEAFISIHAAREGGDGYNVLIPMGVRDFNPRRP